MKTYLFFNSKGDMLMIHADQDGWYPALPYDGRTNVIKCRPIGTFHKGEYLPHIAEDGAFVHLSIGMVTRFNPAGYNVIYRRNARDWFINRHPQSAFRLDDVLADPPQIQSEQGQCKMAIAMALNITEADLPRFEYHWDPKTAAPADNLLLEKLRQLGARKFTNTYHPKPRSLSQFPEKEFESADYPDAPGTLGLEFMPNMRVKVHVPLRHSIQRENAFGFLWYRRKTCSFNAIELVVRTRDEDPKYWGFEGDPKHPMVQMDYYLRGAYSNKFLEYYFENMRKAK